MTTFDWSGLRTRRLLIAAGALVVFPGSCAGTLAGYGGPSALAGAVGLLVGVAWVRAWRCPRCARRFAAQRSFPWVAPFGGACRACGLPDYTPSADQAPPVTELLHQEPRPLGPVEAKRRDRTRVAFLFVVPLLYLTMCRLPDGEPVRTPAGRTVRVLGMARNTTWAAGGGARRSLVLTYYAPAPADSANAVDVLALALPMVRATGDSVVALQQLRGDWWARNLGLRVSYQRAYRLQSDGTWAGL